jgi:hypothetical protein
MTHMQVLTPHDARRTRPEAIATVGGFIVGAGLVACGLALGYLTISTSIVDRLMRSGRPGSIEQALGVVGWAVALVAPAVFMLVGLVRVAGSADDLLGARARRPAISRFAATLGDQYLAATRLRLPDGRTIPELVLGPHGIAIFEALPPPSITRHNATRWEVRTTDGRWMPFENPLDRAERDAERVRRWVAAIDQDFVVKVHAAVIAPDTSLPRSPQCAVITRDQVPAFLASLPPQRSLTDGRRALIVELIEAAVGPA